MRGKGKARQEWYDAPGFRYFVGRHLISNYVAFAMKTSTVEFHPPDYNERVRANYPVLYAMWHANMTAMAHVVPDHDKARAVSADHPDGLMGAAAVSRWGKSILTTGASAGSREILAALENGVSVLMTADVPPIRGRNTSRGLIRLARLSGRPIVPVAVASTNRTIIEKLWDKMQVNHPFSRVVVVGGAHINVDDSLDDGAAVALLKERLDSAYAKALEITAKPAR